MNLEMERAKMGKFRDAIQQAKGEFAEQNRIEQETRAKKGLTDDEFAKYGRTVLDETCAGKRVRLYENCYVRVSYIAGGEFEKLLGVSGTADVAKKTALGRTLAAGATMGFSLLSSNKRGDMYLTITTDRKAHQMHMSPPTELELKSMHKISTTASSLLSLEISRQHDLSAVTGVPLEPGSPVSIADELKKLTELLSQGLITEEEFVLAKSKILS
jgi:hypothetical protein